MIAMRQLTSATNQLHKNHAAELIKLQKRKNKHHQKLLQQLAEIKNVLRLPGTRVQLQYKGEREHEHSLAVFSSIAGDSTKSSNTAPLQLPRTVSITMYIPSLPSSSSTVVLSLIPSGIAGTMLLLLLLLLLQLLLLMLLLLFRYLTFILSHNTAKLSPPQTYHMDVPLYHRS